MPWLKNQGYAYRKYLAQQMVLHEADGNKFDAEIANPIFIIGANDVKTSSGQILYRAQKAQIEPHFLLIS